MSPQRSPRVRVPARVSPRAMPGCSRERPDRSTQHPTGRFLRHVQHLGFVPQPTSPSKTWLPAQAGAWELLLCSGDAEGVVRILLCPEPPGSGSCPTAAAGHPMAEVLSVGPQLSGRGCPDSGRDASPGAQEAASPESFSSSVTPVRLKLNTLCRWRNLSGSVSFLVIPEQGTGPPATTRQLTGSHPHTRCGEGGELAAAKMRSEDMVMCQGREREQATPGEG